MTKKKRPTKSATQLAKSSRDAHRKQVQQNQLIRNGAIALVAIVLIVIIVITLQNRPASGGGESEAALGERYFGGCPGEGEPFGAERPLAGIDPAARNDIFPEYPETVIDEDNCYETVIVTEKGDMRLRLFDDATPLTVNSFVYLASQGFYDGVTFHRVLEDFMAQGGDPLGQGFGGPGYQFVNEIDPAISFDRRGLLAMANSGPDTNGSQFFITFTVERTQGLTGSYTIFGELIEGNDVLSSISLREPEAATTPGDTIERIDIFEYQ